MQGKNTVNPVGLTSILTKAKAKILPLKSGSYDSRLLKIIKNSRNAYSGVSAVFVWRAGLCDGLFGL